MFASNTSQVSSDAVFVEDIFSTTLYTGNGSTQTITNGIDLSTKGGLVWAKMRSNGSTTGHVLSDTARGPSQKLDTSSTGASSNWTPYGISAFGSTGFTVADDGAGNYITNNSGVNYASWTFRKQPKFFDVVTYTGNGTTQNIAHNLGSVPGCIIVKEASAAGNDWQVYHRSTTNTCGRLFLNLTNAENANGRANTWGDNTNPVPPTSTVFTVGNTGSVNNNGATFVAYLFAHDAGGFGLTGTDNVISCGSFTTDGSGNATVDLGYEPQWLLVKANASGNDWYMYDNMRGLSYSNYVYLSPNLSAAEGNIAADYLVPTATGFKTKSFAGSTTYIYIAIRRGPMKVPTSGTSVFQPASFTSTASRQTMGSLPVVDMFMGRRTNSIKDWGNASRLTGEYMLKPNLTDAQDAMVTGYGDSVRFDIQNGSSMITSGSGDPFITYNFHRAPSFFDEVCYTASFPAPDYRAVANHNLTVTPELIIIKARNLTDDWYVYHSALGVNKYIRLNSTAAEVSSSNVFAVSSTTFSTNNVPVASTYNYVAYLFATCAGVSKVGSYTGTGTTKQIDCGFTGGARFVLIKRTDSTGDWYVWDTARGIVSGNDPYLLLNSTAAEVTNTDYVDTYSAGFEISSTAPAAINASGGTFIFLAIA